jgi:hypothetical protein
MENKIVSHLPNIPRHTSTTSKKKKTVLKNRHAERYLMLGGACPK